MTRIFLLGPNKWPEDTTDPKAGQKIREAIVADNQDLNADWVIMENDKTPGDNVHKFLAIAPRCTHIFLLWPRDCKSVGTQDELVLWQALQTLKGKAPELYLFHETGVLGVIGEDRELKILDDTGRSPFLLPLLKRGVYEQEWSGLPDLKNQIRQVLLAEIGVQSRLDPAAVRPKAKTAQ